MGALPNRRTRSTSIVSVVCAVVLTLLVGACTGDEVGQDRARCSFDSAAWQAVPADKPRRKQRMAEDLVACRTLLGTGRDEVVGLLGREGLLPYSEGLEYSAGWGLIDPLLLTVHFDRHGLVSSVDLVES
ncbi:hypothetical protein OG216_45960 (plasmid) [Streptomycetaceae bacterium NBC_01309]